MDVQSARIHFDGAWPLMKNNITAADTKAVIEFLSNGSPILTQSKRVAEFEDAWNKWLGTKYSVFVNSGSSANQVTMFALREHIGGGEIIVPTLTWVSDIAAVLQSGFTPVFVDIDRRTLGMSDEQVLSKITSRTKAVFLTHVLGFNALSDRLINELKSRGIHLIEDVCESHGATWHGKKLGTFGLASNFSFYYAHHMSTIEGGMVCTDDEDLYQIVRMMRAHGLVRESSSDAVKSRYREQYSDLNPEFIFAFPAFNVRNTEMHAVIGLSQLRRLEQNNELRRRNFETFLSGLDSSRFQVDFEVEGSCNYAFPLILARPDDQLFSRVTDALKSHGIEYRRGTSGGGNQLRQPYLRKLFKDEYLKYPEIEHVHFYGMYIGNYPELPEDHIRKLCRLLNSV